MITKKQLIAELNKMGIEIKADKIKRGDIEKALAGLTGEKAQANKAQSSKIKDEDYHTMKSLIESLVKEVGIKKIEEYKESLKSDPRVKDLEMRFRWDLWWAAKNKARGSSQGIPADFHKKSRDFKDTHIDTALKKIIKDLKLSETPQKIQADASYYVSEISRILDHAQKNPEFKPKIKITHEGQESKWLDVSLDGLKDLIESYKKHS